MTVFEKEGMLFRTGCDIISAGEEADSCEEIYRLLAEWGPCAPKSPEHMKQRIRNSGDCIIAGYLCENGVWRLVAVLETIKLPTHGILKEFASGLGRNFETLTESGTWASNYKNADTAVMVDVTVASCYRNKSVGTSLRKVSDIFLDNAGYIIQDSEHIITYSPADPSGKIRRFHERRGAVFGIKIGNARPGYVYPDVISMVYKGMTR